MKRASAPLDAVPEHLRPLLDAWLDEFVAQLLRAEQDAQRRPLPSPAHRATEATSP